MEQSQKPNQQPGQGQQIPSQQRNPESADLSGPAPTDQRQTGQGQQDQRPDEDSPNRRAARAESERRQGERRQGERRQGGNDVERDDSADPASKRS